MESGSKIFLPSRNLGSVSNHIPLQVRYIKSRKETLITTCVGKSFHTYASSHFGLLSVSNLHLEDISCMSSDSYHIYTACKCVIYAWRRGSELKHTYKGHEKPVYLMLPFGAHLLSVDESGCVKIWDIKSEEQYSELNFKNEKFQITTMIHPSTYINKILFGANTGEMQLWNINSMKLIYAFKGWGASITCMQQAPAIDVVAIGLATGKIILHNIKCDISIMEFTQDWGLVTAIAFRMDGKPIMATGSTVGHIIFWDLEEKKMSSQLLAAHNSSVTGMVGLSNEPILITSSPDNSLKMWIFDMTDGGARLLKLREGHSLPPICIRFHGDNGHNILSSSSDCSLRIFNTQTEQFNKSLGRASYNRKISKKRGHGVDDPLLMPPIVDFDSVPTREKEWDNIAAIHSNLAIVTTWSYDKVKMGNLKLLPEFLQKNKKKINIDVMATALFITTCGNFVIIGYSSGHVSRFNLQSGLFRENYGQKVAHEGPVRGVASDALSQIIVTAGRDGWIKFWRFKNKDNDCFHKINLEIPIKFIRSHQKSSILAMVLENFSIYVMDIETYQIIRKLSGHTGQITDAAFSPDARWLITSAMDCTIKTWDIPSGQLIDHFGIEFPCISLSFSPTGEHIVTAHSEQKGLFIWKNKTLYTKVSLKAIDSSDKVHIVALPESRQDLPEPTNLGQDEDDLAFKSLPQISHELITLSGTSVRRWENCLNIDVIKKKNKPIHPPKAPKAAPFFLPTASSINFNFDFKNSELNNSEDKFLMPKSLTNHSVTVKLLMDTLKTHNLLPVIEQLNKYGRSQLDLEIKSLAFEDGGSEEAMLQFLKCIEYMLMSNLDFDKTEVYLGLFLKSHGSVIAERERLRNYLSNIQSCHNVSWNRLHDKLLYSLCIIQNLKM